MATNKKETTKNNTAASKQPATANNAVEPAYKVTLRVKREKVNSKAQAYVDAINKGETDEDVLKTRKKSATKAMQDYNMELAHATYRDWVTEGLNPVLEAVTVRNVPFAKKLSFGKNDDGTANFKFEDAEIKISLPDMAGVVDASCFASKDWFYKVQNLAELFVNKLKRELKDKGFMYEIEEAAKAFNFDEAVCGKLYSNKFFLNALQQTFDAILVIPAEDGTNKIKVDIEEDDNGVLYSPAWTTTTLSLTRQSKVTGKVDVGDYYKAAELVLDCMHVIATNKNWGLNLFK